MTGSSPGSHGLEYRFRVWDRSVLIFLYLVALFLGSSRCKNQTVMQDDMVMTAPGHWLADPGISLARTKTLR